MIEQVLAYKTVQVMKRPVGTYFMKRNATYLCECKDIDDAIRIVNSIRGEIK